MRLLLQMRVVIYSGEYLAVLVSLISEFYRTMRG